MVRILNDLGDHSSFPGLPSIFLDFFQKHLINSQSCVESRLEKPHTLTWI